MREQLKRLVWEWRGVLISAPSVAGLVILLRFLGLFQSWEWSAYDQYLRLRPPERRDERIAIIGIDEADLRAIGQPLIPDQVYARLLEKLKAMKPRAIGLDVYRDLPVEPGHQQLVRVFESTPNLVGIQKVVGDSRGEAVSPPPALKAKGQVGANDLILEADSKVRRALLDVQAPNEETVYSFGLYLALLYLDKEGISPQPVEGTKNWRLGKTLFVPFETNDGGYVRADDRGFQIVLNYRGTAQHIPRVSMTDVLNGKLPIDWGRDRIILIGRVGETAGDLYFTPYSSGLVSLPERMPGVEIHANITSQILSAALQGRPLIQSWSEPVEMAWILLWSAIGAFLTWQWRYTPHQRWLSFRKGTVMLSGGALVLGTYLALWWGWWIPMVPPVVALFGSAIAVTSYVAHTAGQIRKAFGRYLTDSVVASLLENPDALKIGGENRKLTILTSDLRGFTALSERFPPQEIVKILNIYLECMTEVITEYQGTIDEFMGDGILVLFGAPTQRNDDSARAVACAVAMQLALISLNDTIEQLGFPKLEMGIGINTGVVVVGNIGSEKRTKYSVIGSHVNLTYRIESYTVGGQILISESTFKEVKSIVKIDGQKEVQPKGVIEPITIYEVGGIGGNYNLFMARQEEVLCSLPKEICLQFHYTFLDGKHISNSLFQGRLIKISAKGGEVRPEKQEAHAIPEPLSNIKINFLKPDSPTEASGDIYAKVLENKTQNGNFCIHFTYLPPDIEAMLATIYKSYISES